jgi:hypothetical protein
MTVCGTPERAQAHRPQLKAGHNRLEELAPESPVGGIAETDRY